MNLIKNCKAEYSKNLLSTSSSYVTTNAWIVTGGIVAINSNEIVYSGAKSLKLDVKHSSNTKSASSPTDVFTALKNGKYVFGFRIYEDSLLSFSNNFNNSTTSSRFQLSFNFLTVIVLSL